MKSRKLESGAEFLVDEAGGEALGSEGPWPLSRVEYQQLAFEALFVAGAGRFPAAGMWMSFCGENCLARARLRVCEARAANCSASGHRGLETQAEETASPAEGGVRRVVNGVVLEDAAFGCSTDSAKPAQQRGHVVDTQLDLDFAVGGPGHGPG